MRLPGRCFLSLLLAGVLLAPVSMARADNGRHEPEPVSERLLDLAAAGQSEKLASLLEDVRNRSDWDHARRERVLYRFVTGVRRLAPERVPLAQLHSLADYEPRVMEAHPESRGALMLPRFDIAGAAAGSIEHAWRRLRVTELSGKLASEPAAFWSKSLDDAPGALDPGVQAELVTRVDADALRAGRDALLTAWRADPRLAPAMTAAALRLADASLARAILTQGSGPYPVRLIRSVAERFPADEAVALLIDAALRPDLVSPAVLELGRLAQRVPAARDWLMEQLDTGSHGASAAAALARLDEPVIVDKTAGALTPARTGAGLRNRLLLLHLSDTPAARRALSAFVEDPAMPVALRREVSQWQ